MNPFFLVKFYPPVLDVIDRNTCVTDFIYYHVYRSMGIFVVPYHYIERCTFLRNALVKFYNEIDIFERFQDTMYNPEDKEKYVTFLLQWKKKVPEKRMSISTILRFLNENTELIVACNYFTMGENNARIYPVMKANSTKSIMGMTKEIHGKNIEDVRIVLLVLLCSILAERRIYAVEYISFSIVWNHPEMEFYRRVMGTMDFRDVGIRKYDDTYTEMVEFSRMNMYTGENITAEQYKENMEYSDLVKRQYIELRKKCTQECRLSKDTISNDVVKRVFVDRETGVLKTTHHHEYPYDIFMDGILLLNTTRIRQHLLECLNHTVNKRAMCLIFMCNEKVKIVQPTIATQRLLHEQDIDMESIIPYDVKIDTVHTIRPFLGQVLFYVAEYPKEHVVFDMYFDTSTSTSRIFY